MKSWIERDRWGRPRILQPSGKRIGYRRVTTFSGSLDDKTTLNKWSGTRVVLGMAREPELVERARCLDPIEDRQELDEIREEALQAGGASDAAELGSAIHLFTERLDKGEEPGLCYTGDIAQREENYHPGEGRLIADSRLYEEHLAYYMTMTQDIEWLAIESFRVHDDMQVAGTADRIGRDKQGRVRVYDLKTGSLHGPSMSMQLGMYAHMKPYDMETDERQPIEEGMDYATGVIIHLPVPPRQDAWTEDGPRCDMWEIDIARGYGACNLGHGVFNWRKSKDLLAIMPKPWETEQPLQEVAV